MRWETELKGGEEGGVEREGVFFDEDGDKEAGRGKKRKKD